MAIGGECERGGGEGEDGEGGQADEEGVGGAWEVGEGLRKEHGGDDEDAPHGPGSTCRASQSSPLSVYGAELSAAAWLAPPGQRR